MSKVKCPGQDTRFWQPEDIFVLQCPKCEADIEFFKDDSSHRCHICGNRIRNPKLELGCAEWCEMADKCLEGVIKK